MSIKWKYRKLYINKILRRFLPADLYFYISKSVVHGRDKTKIDPLDLSEFRYFDNSDITQICLEFFHHTINHEFCIFGDKYTQYSIKHGSNTNYSPIAWNTDYKSGYSFDNQTYSFLLKTTIGDGIDIKNPWELARLQHLPQLALSSISNFDIWKKSKEEFINELVDFSLSNPFLHGIHWMSPMEVSIRSANIILAYSLFCINGDFNDNEDRIVKDILLDSYYYILYNLEVNLDNGLNGNHYLANLCGLLFICKFLKNRSTQSIISFLANEIQMEIKKQFFEDGGGFEFSTTYTSFTAEMASYSVSILISMGIPIDKSIINRLSSTCDFLESVYRPNGEILQIGDNDSGFFFKLFNCLTGNSPQTIFDNLLTYRSGLNALKGIFGYKDDAYSLITRNLLHGSILKRENSYKPQLDIISCPEFERKYVIRNIIERTVDCNDLEPIVYPQFGLAIFGNTSKLYIRLPICISSGLGAHSHIDFLHYEFSDKESTFLSDQGSAFYNPFPNIRSFMRSAQAHNVPQFKFDLCDFTGLWGINQKFKGGCSKLTKNSMEIWVQTDSFTFIRRIIIRHDGILIEDMSDQEFKYKLNTSNYISPGYGRLYDSDGNLFSNEELNQLNQNFGGK